MSRQPSSGPANRAYWQHYVDGALLRMNNSVGQTFLRDPEGEAKIVEKPDGPVIDLGRFVVTLESVEYTPTIGLHPCSVLAGLEWAEHVLGWKFCRDWIADGWTEAFDSVGVPGYEKRVCLVIAKAKGPVFYRPRKKVA